MTVKRDPVGDIHLCGACGQRFTTTAQAEAHIRTAHPKAAIRPAYRIGTRDPAQLRLIQCLNLDIIMAVDDRVTEDTTEFVVVAALANALCDVIHETDAEAAGFAAMVRDTLTQNWPRPH